MLNRFHRHNLGDGILSRMRDVRIHLYRCDGRLCGEFRISGKIGSSIFEDDDEADGDTATLPADDSQFVRELLAEFQKER